MKNETNLFKRIRNIIVGNTLPKNEDLWLDTSNGEKKAVLKYKGYPIVGGASGGGSGSGSDYQSSGSIVKDMIEQGQNFNWAKYAIDIPSLPCFKPEAEWPWEKIKVRNAVLDDVLAEGYAAVSGFIVRVTGENPDVTVTPQRVPTFVDCEPVVITEYAINPSGPVSFSDLTSTNVKPIRYIVLGSNNRISRLEESYSVEGINVPMESAVVIVSLYPSEDRTTVRELVSIADGGTPS